MYGSSMITQFARKLSWFISSMSVLLTTPGTRSAQIEAGGKRFSACS